MHGAVSAIACESAIRSVRSERVDCMYNFLHVHRERLGTRLCYKLLAYLHHSQSAVSQCPAVRGMQPNAKLFHLLSYPCSDLHCGVDSSAISEHGVCILP